MTPTPTDYAALLLAAVLGTWLRRYWAPDALPFYRDLIGGALKAIWKWALDLVRGQEGRG